MRGGRGPSRAVPTLRATRAVPGRHPLQRRIPCFGGRVLLLSAPPGSPLGPCPERAVGVVAIRRLPSRQLGGCRCGHTAADLHVCLRRATFKSLCFPPRGCQRAAVSRELLPTPRRALPGTRVTRLLPPVPRIGGSGSAGWLSSTWQVGNLRLPCRVLLLLVLAGSRGERCFVISACTGSPARVIQC